VTASKKVLLAAVLLTAGYGAARLLGGPGVASLPHTFQSADAGSGASQRAADSYGQTIAPAAGPYPIGSARLVPDKENVRIPQLEADEATPIDVPRVESALPLAGTSATATVVPAIDASFRDRVAPLPRAKLRNEAPRPLAVEPRSPEVSRSNQGVSARSSTEALVPAQFARNHTTSVDAASTRDVTANTVLNAAHLAPLPISSPSDENEPRAHIIVDGDSLAKLAGRYLDDPRRAAEIYELNRHLLSDPQLLPIGAELIIPSRAAAATNSIAPSPHSRLPRAVAIHTAVGSGLVPVRPIPSASGLTPRAYLSQPRPAE
jgi:nucleoid-associated protein YgaU